MSRLLDLVLTWRDNQPDTERDRARLVTEAATGDRLAHLVLDAIHCQPRSAEPAAWRLHSKRLARDLWVARDGDAATALDGDGIRNGLPVVLADDLERLRDFTDQRLNDLLDVLSVFPGARLGQLEPEGTA
jgi:hypothetical protein